MPFRTAGPDDVPAICDLMTALDLDEPWDPVLWRHRVEVWRLMGNPTGSHLLEVEGRPTAVAEWWFRPPPPGGRRFGGLRVGTVEADPATFRSGLELVEGELRGIGVDAFSTATREGEDFRPAMLREAGYREDRVGRLWELDLVAQRGRLEAAAAAGRDAMERQGVRLTTVVAALATDPQLLRQVYEVDRRATQDIPTTVPHLTPPFKAWLRDFESPVLHPDRQWLAMAGGEVLGMSWLMFPVVRGHVYTAWTGVAPAARGRGVARALKLETLRQAIELGVRSVRTENDEQNAPILHLNQELGYRPIPGRQLWLKGAEPGEEEPARRS